MKISLFLRRILVALGVSGMLTTTAQAEIMSSAILRQVYQDMGNNMGAYRPGAQNIGIIGEDGTVLQTIELMPDFRSMSDFGRTVLIAPNMQASVAHNPASYFTETYSKRYLGSNSGAQSYTGLRTTFAWSKAGTDFVIARTNRIVTDAPSAVICTDKDILASLKGRLLYRAGGGTMYVRSSEGTVNVTPGYSILGAGISVIKGSGYNPNTGVTTFNTIFQWNSDDVSASNPLPFQIQSGDSGSPSWIWNEKTNRYEYIGAGQATGGPNSHFKGNNDYVVAVQEALLAEMALGSGSALTWSAAERAGVNAELVKPMLDLASTNTPAYDADGRVVSVASESGTFNLYAGTISGKGSPAFEYIGINAKNGNTYRPINLSSQNWYGSSPLKRSEGELFFTTNIRLKASADTYEIAVDGNVDTGIGSVEFDRGEQENAVFMLRAANADSSLHTAGFIINEGVTVVSELTGNSEEWRAIGGGTYRIRGTGNNYIGLNIGGGLATFLERSDGYAAYNVLLSTGATLTIQDAGQIGNNLTFGSGGGTLDMNGNDLVWESTTSRGSGANFALSVLSEDAVITNRKAGTVATLTFSLTGDETMTGSFQNGEGAALRVVYNGAGNWTWNGTATDLSGAGGGLDVQNGRVTLVGSLTRHAGMRNLTTYTYYDNDWHYAAAAMNVSVASGAEFELGSHALLTGNVTVENGGRFIMREGVAAREECVEGWYIPVDVTTESMRRFYGLKGDVELKGASSSMLIQPSRLDLDTVIVYDGSISGEGRVEIDLGVAGTTLYWNGRNTFSGEKTLTSGTLIVAGSEGLGDTNSHRWIIGSDGILASMDFDGSMDSATILGTYIDGSSTGVLALTADREEQFSLSGHQELFIGALEGHSVQFGAAGTTERLEAEQGMWKLGGGGGELVVNFLLEGDNDLVLGPAVSTGKVTLANTENSFSGNVVFSDRVILAFTDERALGTSTLLLGYSNAAASGVSKQAFMDTHIAANADGIMLLEGETSESLDMRVHAALALGAERDATFSGNLTVAENGAYRFGGMGLLTIVTPLAANGVNDLVIDAQGFSGGNILLNAASEISGSVTVQGYREGSGLEGLGANIALSFGVDDALSSTTSVRLERGAILDLNGTRQQLRNLDADSSSRLIDSGTTPGVLTLVVDGEHEIAGAMELRELAKKGEGTLTLSGDAFYDSFSIDAGKVRISNDRAFSGTITVAGGATLSLTAIGEEKTLLLDSGAVLETDASSALQGGVAVRGGEATIRLGGETNVAGAFEVAENATAFLDIAAGEKATFSGASVNVTGGGTLSLRSGRLAFDSTRGQTIGGTVVLNNGVDLYCAAGVDDLSKTFDHVVVNGAVSVTDTDSAADRLSHNMLWTVHDLSGAGTLQWNAGTYGSKAGHFVLDGANDFSGTIVVARRDRAEGDSNIAYGGFLELRHDAAAQHAVIELRSLGIMQSVALAVNTGNAHVEGIRSSGDAGLIWSSLYAGEASERGVTNVKSTRQATLTFTGSGRYEYWGEVRGGDAGKGLSLVMDGAGTQEIKGRNVEVENVAVRQGRLVLGSGKIPYEYGSLTSYVQISGDVSIARGASLSIYGGLTLNAGRTLTLEASATGMAGSGVLAADSGQTALTLNGGNLCFDGGAMNDSSAVLSVGSIARGSAFTEQGVQFTSTNLLKADTVYRLIDGNFSGFASSEFRLANIDFWNAAFGVSANGLTVSFSLADGCLLWDGTETAHAWNDSVFGAQSNVPGAESTVLFNDTAAFREVSISGGVSVSAMSVDTSETYVFQSENGGGVETGSFQKLGVGTARLESGVRVAGSTVVDGGVLLVKDAATLAGTVSGNGTVAVDWTGQSGSLQLAGLDTLEIIAGRYEGTAAADVRSVVIRDGGRFDAVDGTYAQNFTLAGNGWNMPGQAVENAKIGALYLNKATLSGSLDLSADAGILVGTGGATLGGTVATGEFVLTKYGTGLLNVTNTGISGHFEVAEGTMALGEGRYNSIESISLGRNTRLTLKYGAGIATECDIAMADGASIWLTNGAGTSSTLAARILLEGTAAIAGSKFGGATRVSGSIAGNGKLRLMKTDADNVWNLDSTISDGTASGDVLALAMESGKVVLGGSNTYSGGTLLSGGNLTVSAGSSLGKGALNIAGGSLTWQTRAEVAGVSGNGGKVTLAAGSELVVMRDSSYGGTVEGAGILGVGDNATWTYSGSFLKAGALAVASGSRLNFGNRGSMTATSPGRAAVVTGLAYTSEGSGSVLGGSSPDAIASLAGARVEWNTPASLTLRDMAIAADAAIAANGSVLNLSNVRLAVVEGRNAVGSASAGGLAAGTVLALSGNAGMTTTLGSEESVYSIECSSFEGLRLEGTELTLDMSFFASDALSLLGEYDYFSVSFDSMPMDLTALTVTADFGTEMIDGYGLVDSMENARMVYFNAPAFVPEPGCATLSVAAVVAMLFRRRRPCRPGRHI